MKFSTTCLFFCILFATGLTCQKDADYVFENVFMKAIGLELYAQVNSVNNSNMGIALRSNPTHKLDSMIIPRPMNEGRGKNIYIIDSGKDITANFDFNPSSGIWIPDWFQVHHYDFNNRVVKVTYNTRSWKEGEYVDTLPSNQLIYIYNEDDLLQEFYTQNLEHIVENRIRSRRTFKYDIDGRLIECSKYAERNGADTLFRSRQEFFHYNLQGQLAYSLRWDEHFSLGWINNDSTVYEYEGNRLLRRTSYNPGRTYPPPNTLISVDHHYEYHPNGFLKEVFSYDHDDTEPPDNPIWREHGERFRHTEDWDLNSWSTWSEFENNGDYIQGEFYEYHRELKLDNVTHPRHLFNNSLERPMSSAPIYRSKWESSLDGYQSFEYNYYYSEIDPVSTIDLATPIQELSLCPNPASNLVYLISTGPVRSKHWISIYDIDCKEYLNQEVSIDEALDISDLPSGAYIYKIGKDDKEVIGKLIKS